MKINNKVIVIGSNHVNTLGVIRSLGEEGIFPFVILHESSRYCYVKKSRYIKEFWITDDESEIINILNELSIRYSDTKNIIIPTSDLALKIIDENFNVLSQKFYIPNIDNRKGKIIINMDKKLQQDDAKKVGLNSIFSIKLNLKNKINNSMLKDIPYPCIIKPNSSYSGKKGDIVICDNQEKCKKELINLQQLGYKEVLVQEFIKCDSELDVIGFACNGDAYYCGQLKKIRISPPKKGSASYGKFMPIDDKEFYKKLSLYIKNLNFTGIFGADVFETKENIFIEINFRNGANNYALTYDGVNIIILWIKSILNYDLSKEKVQITNSFYFRNDIFERVELFKRNITLKEYFKTKKNSKVQLFNVKKDKKPVIFKFIYAILKRL